MESKRELNKVYCEDTTGIGVKFIQRVLNADTVVNDPKIEENSIWGSAMTDIVKKYQLDNGLRVTGLANPATIKHMIKRYPAKWNEIVYEILTREE